MPNYEPKGCLSLRLSLKPKLKSKTKRKPNPVSNTPLVHKVQEHRCTITKMQSTS